MKSKLNKALSEMTKEDLFNIEGGCDCCVSDSFADAKCCCCDDPPVVMKYGVPVTPKYGVPIVLKYGVVVPEYGVTPMYGVTRKS